MFKITLARRQLLPRFRRLPQIDLPRVRVDFPEEVRPPWQEIKVERVTFVMINPETFKFNVIFG